VAALAKANAEETTTQEAAAPAAPVVATPPAPVAEKPVVAVVAVKAPAASAPVGEEKADEPEPIYKNKAEREKHADTVRNEGLAAVR